MTRWTGMLIGYCGVALAISLLIYVDTAGTPANREIAKLIVQFLLVTGGGAVVVAWLNQRRESDQRELARQAAVRDLATEVNSGYRRFKSVKRRLRAQIVQGGWDDHGRTPPFTFDGDDFEKSMDELLQAQIAFEILRDTVRARHDLLLPETIGRIFSALNYAARYFHDVYQDFENGRVVRRNGRYEVGPACEGIADFVGRRAWSDGARAPWGSAIEAEFKHLRNARELSERYQALQAIVNLRATDKADRRADPHYAKAVRPIRRYRIVATEAIDLAFLDIQQALPKPRQRYDAVRTGKGTILQQEATVLRNSAAS